MASFNFKKLIGNFIKEKVQEALIEHGDAAIEKVGKEASKATRVVIDKAIKKTK